jgi:tetratricopeptide (TPR) repeat protein
LPAGIPAGIVMKNRKAQRRKTGRTGPAPAGTGGPTQALFRQGLALHEQGKYAEAAGIYRRVLEADPKHLDARNNLGNVLRNMGNADEAVACYLDVIAIDPNYHLAQFNLGNFRRDEGKLEEAAACFRRTLDLHPNYGAACNNLGVTLMDLGRLEEAIPWLYRAVTLDKRFVQAHINLGNALRDQGKPNDAAKCYRQAIKIDPRYVDARCNLGSLLRKEGQLEESMACYNAARKINPNYPLVRFGIAETLFKQGKLEAALTAFDRAIEADPQNADIHNNKGNVLRLLERMDEAQACYRTAMELNPDHPDARLNYAIEQPFTPDDPNFDRLKAQLDRPGTDEEKRIQLIFALARGCDAAGHFDDAMAHFNHANALKAKTVQFDRQAHRAIIKNIRTFFPEARPLKQADAASSKQTPVFLLGMSRSGKTLAESLLKQDPRIFGGGERYYFIDALHDIRREQGIAETFPDCLPRMDDTMIADMGARYMAGMRKLSDAPFLLNTLPGHCLHLGWILRTLPAARVIYCRREPLDQCLRIYFKLFAGENIHAYTFENIAAYHDGYHTLMDHWRSLYSERILEVQYENMVRDPHATARRMFAHLGLEVDTAALQVDFSTHEIGQWQNYKAHIGALQAALAGLIA